MPANHSAVSSDAEDCFKSKYSFNAITTMSDGTMKAHRGGLILTFGILGLILCFPFGIAAWIMGNSDLAEIRAGRMDPSGEQLVTAGKICGMIATILVIIGFAFALIFGFLGMMGSMMK